MGTEGDLIFSLPLFLLFVRYDLFALACMTLLFPFVRACVIHFCIADPCRIADILRHMTITFDMGSLFCLHFNRYRSNVKCFRGTFYYMMGRCCSCTHLYILMCVCVCMFLSAKSLTACVICFVTNRL